MPEEPTVRQQLVARPTNVMSSLEADSHSDSHGGDTPSAWVESVDERHARHGRGRTLDVGVNGFPRDF
jgi:hypothetical protein